MFTFQSIKPADVRCKVLAPASQKTHGFNPGAGGAGYTYDANGNLKTDSYKRKFDVIKGITNIAYNHLNLPNSITFSSGNTIEWVYDAAGMKLRKIVKQGATVQYEQTYAGGLEYRKNGTGSTRVEAIQHAEGRYLNLNAEVNNTLLWQKEYALRDHLGNTRMMFADKNANGIVETPGEIVQENHYYPFGLGYEGPWLMNDAVARDNKYQYNGKEWNDDWGLKWNDYGARWYDAAIGRWGAVDPLTEMYLGISPYTYVANNPLKFIDPNGKQIDVGIVMRRNGKEQVTITYTGVVEPDGASLSKRDIRQLSKMIKQQLKSSFSGSGYNVTWKTKVNLSILGSGEKAGANDNRIVLTNSSNPNLNGRTGAAPNGFDAYIDTQGRSLGDIAKTAVHEVGHNMGLPHNIQDVETIKKETTFGTLNTPIFLQPNTIQPGHPAAGNLMLPGTQVDAAGTNITPSQIRHIIQDFRAGKLNSRTISGGDEPFGVYSTDKPIVNIYGEVTKD